MAPLYPVGDEKQTHRMMPYHFLSRGGGPKKGLFLPKIEEAFASNMVWIYVRISKNC